MLMAVQQKPLDVGSRKRLRKSTKRASTSGKSVVPGSKKAVREMNRQSYMNRPNTFSKQLQKALAMTHPPLTHAELAKVCGISRTGVTQYTSGKALPDLGTVVVISKELERRGVPWGPERLAYGVDYEPVKIMPPAEEIGTRYIPEITFGAGPEDRKEVRKWGIALDALQEQGISVMDELIAYRAREDTEGIEFGDRLILDCSDRGRTPSPPGRFVIWDGFAPVVATISLLPGSAAGKRTHAKVTTASGESEQEVGKLQIIGRIRGIYRKV